MTNTIHPFEKAGLGKAPFRCTGMTTSTYQACPGAPIQPGSTCDYCGTGIMSVFAIRSADGKTFKVGCDCVAKTGAACAKTDAERTAAVLAADIRKIKLTAKHARDGAKIDAIRARLADPTIRLALGTVPHPVAFRAERGETLIDSLDWYMANAGTTGRLKVAKIIDAGLAAAAVVVEDARRARIASVEDNVTGVPNNLRAPSDLPDAHDHVKGDGSWWAKDGNGIELCRVCAGCKARKLARYRPEILRPYTSADVDESIEPS